MSDILENIETPIEEEANTPSNALDGALESDGALEEVLEIPQRVNPFCVISKATFGEYAVRDIQTNSAWGANPYGEEYAVVTDDMVADILETKGFCDIELNEEGTEVVWFTAREIPEIPTEEEPPSDIDILYEIEADQELRICCLEMGLSADDFA